MRVLLLGSGGRESALAAAFARSSSVEELVAAPGNPGIREVASLERVDIESGPAVVELARRIDADLVVVGPEAPLVAGVADALRLAGINVFGPAAVDAELEGSKAFAKDVMQRAGVPVPRWGRFSDAEKAIAFLDELGSPYVVKADGLAAGKGVVVSEDRAEAVAAIDACVLGGRFGSSGRTVVVEEHLAGEEVSLIAFSDGRTVIPCEPAQDYKRVFENDEGPNTGGMGSYSPVPVCPPELSAQIVSDFMEPVVRALGKRDGPGHYSGVLYAGMMLTPDGPRVLEFNVRFGDPETQALLPRLDADLGEVCMASATGELAGSRLGWKSDACVAVVLASGGYPGSHETGFEITGIAKAQSLDGIEVYQAGTAMDGDRIVTAGGRVLAVSALGRTFGDARSRAYDAADAIEFEGKHVRRDIGLRAEKTEREDSRN
jgi:phosphoribosylamine---glycine ligase